MDEDLDFNIDEGQGPRSSSKLGQKPSGAKPAGKSPSSTSRKSKLVDSGVRMVGTDKPSDSDVKITPADEEVQLAPPRKKTPSDSDIRLEDLPAGGRGKGSDPALITEEIDLDAEARKAEAQKPPQKGKPRTKHQPALPTTSPFELSESGVGQKPGDKPAAKDPAKKGEDSSSDFELIPFDNTKSPVELGSGEIPLLDSDEDVGLGSEVRVGPGNSGINLQDPADSGISLEQGGSDEIEFELSLDSAASPKPAPHTPTPAKAKAEDSSSEFELSLDDSSDASDSEFELSLDEDGGVGLQKVNEDSSDSEFELTLDEEGGLAAADSDVLESDEKDIFEETNFDVPALDESGSEAVALDEGDTGMEGSDFKISMDCSDSSEDSDSAVVAVDEEDADAGAATVARPRKSKAKAKAKAVEVEEEEDLDDISGSGAKRAVVAEEEEEEAEAVAAAAPAEWGPLPAILLFPAVLVLFVVGLMGFELVRGMWGYHRPSPVGKPLIDAIARQVDDSLPK